MDQELKTATARSSFNSDYFELKTLIREMVERYANQLEYLHPEHKRVYLKLVLAMEEV